MSYEKCKCGKEACNCTGSTCGTGASSCACGKERCSCGTGSTTGTGDVHQVSCEELQKKMAAGDVLVVNVLDSEHYNDCHIAGTKHVPLDGLKEACADWDKDKKVVVYCASYMCSASKEAAKLLSSLGFSKVCCYEGGTREWKEKGLPCEGACSMDYVTK